MLIGVVIHLDPVVGTASFLPVEILYLINVCIICDTNYKYMQWMLKYSALYHMQLW